MKGAGSVLIILSALAAGVGAGRGFRDGAKPPGAVPSAVGVLTDSPAPGAEVGNNSAIPDTGPASLPEWNPARTAAENALDIYAALERVPAARIAEWLRAEYRLPVNYSSSQAARAWEVMRDALLDRLREKDPAAFAAWVGAMPADNVQWPWVRDAVETLRLSGSPEAAAAAARLKAAHPEQWRMAEMELLSESDPEAALVLAAGNRGLGLPEACAALLAADPARALAYVKDHPFSLNAVAAAFQRLGPEALESFAEKCPGDADASRAVWQLVAADKARRGDGKAFAAFLLAHPGINETSAGLLAEADPAAAAEAVSALAGSPAAQERVLASLASADPALAARLLAASPNAAALLNMSDGNFGLGEPLLPTLTRAWMLRDPAAFRTWALSLPADLQAKVLPQAANSLSGAEFLDFTRGVPLTDDAAANRLGNQAARNAPDTARLLSWLSGFPEADREKLTAGITGSLAASDLPAATELTVNHPDLQQRERMIRSVGGQARFPDAGAAVAWGNSLPADMRVSGLSGALDGMASKAGGYSALGQTVTEVIAAEPPETAGVWSGIAGAVARDMGRKSLAEGAAFVSGLPEAARESGARALADNLLNTLMGGAGDPLSPLGDLERLEDPGVRRKIAEIMRPHVPDITRLSPDQSAALSGRLETLLR